MKSTSVNPIRMTISLSGAGLREAISLGLAFKGQAEQAGGKGKVIRAPDKVVFDLEGLRPDLIDEWTGAFGETLARKKVDFTVASTPRTTEIPEGVIHGELLREKLTKKLLLSLPPGAWLASDHGNWKVNLNPYMDRRRVWEHAVELGVANRKVSVAWSDGDVEILRTA